MKLTEWEVKCTNQLLNGREKGRKEQNPGEKSRAAHLRVKRVIHAL